MSESIRIAPRVLAGGSFRGSPNKILPMAFAVFAVLSLSIGTLLGAALPAAPETLQVHSFASVTVSLRTMSVYSPKYIGKKMANGDPYNPNALTVASNDWRLGTELTIVHAGRFCGSHGHRPDVQAILREESRRQPSRLGPSYWFG